MSATIPSNKRLDDLLKSTGFDCPENLKGKSFAEATSGGDITIVSAESQVLKKVGTPVNLNYIYDKSLDDKYVVWFKKGQAQINTRDLEVGKTYNYTIQNKDGNTFNIALTKILTNADHDYNITAVFRDSGHIGSWLTCFLIVGASN